MRKIINEIKKILTKNGLTVSTIESCTGGAIAAALTSVEGASKFFYGSMVTYDTNCKINQLGVDPELIEIYDVVSEKVALDMATQGLLFFKTDYCISITGYIGKNQDVKNPGLVCICIRSKKRYECFSICLLNSRLKNRKTCIEYVLTNFLNKLKHE